MRSLAVPHLPIFKGVPAGTQWVIADPGLGRSWTATAAARLTLF